MGCMRQFRVLCQTAIIVDSLAILTLAAFVVCVPKLFGLLPVAGGLAGLNTALHAWTLEGISIRLRTTLLLGGLLTVLAMIIVGILGPRP